MLLYYIIGCWAALHVGIYRKQNFGSDNIDRITSKPTRSCKTQNQIIKETLNFMSKAPQIGGINHSGN